jgi:hypothetical protein
MPSKKDRSWLIQRLERRAKDARQAQLTALKMWLTAYPDAKHLAEVHGEAAAVYERAIIAMTVTDEEPTDN